MGRPKSVKNNNGNKNLTVNNLDTIKLIDDYVDLADWRVSENANIGYSFGGLMLHISGTVNARYALSKIYPEKIAQAHLEGDLHLHDLFMGLNGYCAGWSLRQLLMDGFNGVPGKTYSKPPKHLSTAIGQLVNFLGTLQNEWAGAQAISSFDTYLAPFIAYDKLTYKEVKQAIQQFVFYMNTPSRWGTQTPFSNITLDWTVPSDLGKQPVIIGGKLMKEKYTDFPKEMAMINKAFIEVMMEGDGAGQPFTFPIPTYNITKDFDWDSENALLLFELTAKYGTPYFQNFINSELSPEDTRSMCCRLRLDLKDLAKKTGGLFGFGESTGSVGVVTINLPRIGYLAKTKKDYYKRLGHLMDLAYQSLEIKRKIVQVNMDRGLLPYTKRYLGSLKHHFSTIGLLGGNEACLNFLGKDIISPEGKQFMIENLEFMRKKLEGYQKKSGEIYNLEASPAEGTSYRFAKIDKKKFGDKIIAAGTPEAPYYTNSTQLPVNATDDLFTALEHQDMLQVLYTGGTVLHGFLGEKVSDGKACAVLVKKIAENFHLPYYTITPTFSICQTHGYLKDETKTCPKCGKETLIYSRVVGYLRPVQAWNIGKKQEFKERLEFNEKKSMAHTL